MGEAKQKRSATAKLISEFPHCCFCGGLRPSVTREHMPPRSMFDGAHRPDKLVMPACDVCNSGSSDADQVASIVSRWGSEANAQQKQDHRKLAHALRAHKPELIAEWTTPNADHERATKIRLAKQGITMPPDGKLVRAGPITTRLLNLFAHKVALGLYFEIFRKPLPNSGRVCAIWRTKLDHAGQELPPGPMQMMSRYATMEQGAWNTREVFEFRYEFDEAAGLFICLANIRQGNLLIWGFAVADGTALPPEEAVDWIAPTAMLDLQNDVNPKRQ